MDIQKATALEIGNLNQPVVTLYQISVIIFRLYKQGSYQNEKFWRLKKKNAARSDCRRIVQQLLTRGVLSESASVRRTEVFSILGMKEDSPNEVVCCIDPFAYISHLSAMEWHGLTDRTAHTLFYSSPPTKAWREFARDKMVKDMGNESIEEFLLQNLPRLKRINLQKIGRLTVHRYLSEHLGAFTSIQNRCLRVSTIGRTFLDMLREPDLCGGIYHVLDVFEEHGPRYRKLIVDEIDRHGNQIDKVRAGYILAERMEIDDPRINKWKTVVQRGGSRRLYAGSPYSPEYSEDWCLSINVER